MTYGCSSLGATAASGHVDGWLRALLVLHGAACSPAPLFLAALGWWIEDGRHEAQMSARSSYWASNRLTGGLGNRLTVGLMFFLFFID